MGGSKAARGGRRETSMMNNPPDFRKLGCQECANGKALGFDFTMAFQPIVDCETREVFAHEALARMPGTNSAKEVMSRVDDSNRYRFDQTCRSKAIKLAAEIGMSSYLSINFLPNAVYRPELCIRTTIEAAEQYGFPIDQIIFEITEGEKVDNHAHLEEIVRYYQQTGFKTAIDDFGAGYSGLNLLASMKTDYIKLDRFLVTGIDSDPGKRAIVKGILAVCEDMGIGVIAEGIETQAEHSVLRDMGIRYLQGYRFARPSIESLPVITESAFAEV